MAFPFLLLAGTALSSMSQKKDEKAANAPEDPALKGAEIAKEQASQIASESASKPVTAVSPTLPPPAPGTVPTEVPVASNKAAQIPPQPASNIEAPAPNLLMPDTAQADILARLKARDIV